MAGKLTKQGYIKRSPEEIQKDLVALIKSKIPDFTLQPADLQSNLINTAIEDILQYEDLTEMMLNSYGPSFSNDYVFKKFAESIGLSPHKESNSLVTLTFSGDPYTFIPKGTTCSGGGVEVKTTEDGLISSTGEKDIPAESESKDLIAENSITNIDSLNISGLSVTNKNIGVAGLEAESMEQLRKRVQLRFRSPRKGGIDYTYSVLTSVHRVDPRLIRFRIIDPFEYSQTTLSSGAKTFVTRGVEAIIGGGKDEDVALALFQGFLETSKLVSQPSDGNTDRTINININYYGNSIPISFTRPKLLEVGLIVNIAFSGLITTPASLKGVLEDPLTNYINTLPLGNPLSALTITNQILPLLEKAGINSETITRLNFELTIDGSPITPNSKTGFFDEIKHDTYLLITDFKVVVLAG